jgi:DNA-binding MarR family transcriptional regulator
MKRAADTLGFTTRDDRMQLRELNAGQFFAFGPAVLGDGVQLYKIGDVKTTHLRAGQRAQKPPPPTSKIKKMLGELADLPHEAEEEAKSVAELSTKVRELQVELKAAYKAQPAAKIEPKTIEKIVVKPAEVKRLEKVASSFHHYVDMAGVDLERLSKVAAEAKEIANAIAKAIRPQDPAQSHPSNAQAIRRAAPNGHAAAPNRSVVPVSNGELPAGEARVLTALIQYPDGLTGSQLSALTGYTQPTRDKYLTNLSTRGLAHRDRPGHAVAIQPAASHALPTITPLPTGEDLREYWFQRLPQGEAAVLKVICEAWPEEIHGSKISEVTGYTQPTRDKYITNLSGKTIVDRVRPGFVKANPQLFD